MESVSLAGVVGRKATPASQLAGVTISLGSAGASPAFAGTLIGRDHPAITYTGGDPRQAWGTYPGNLFTTTHNLTLADGTRTGAGGGFAFTTDSPVFSFRTLAQGPSSNFSIYVDGRLVSTPAPLFPADGSLRYVNVDLTAAGIEPGFHDIQVVFRGGGMFGGLLLPAGAAIRAVEDLGPRIVFLGDSFTEGTGSPELSQSYVPLTGTWLGSQDIWKSGFGGTGYERVLANRPNLHDRIVADGVNAGGDIYIVAMGLNDSNTSATLGDTVRQTLQQLVDGAPGARIFVLGYWNPGPPGSNLKPHVRSTIADVAGEFPQVTFLDPVRVPFTTIDGTHPDTAGHRVLAEWLTAQIRDALGSDGVIEQNVAGDAVGPLFIEGWRAGAQYTYTVLENGAISTRFEMADAGDAFPVLRLKPGQSVSTVGPISLEVEISDGSAVITRTIEFAVRRHVTGTDGDETLHGTRSDGVSIDAGAGNDLLVGTAGADLLEGGVGNDVISGLGGDDKMIGGAGNDTYFLDSWTDLAVEEAGGGTDAIHTSLPLYALPEHFENLCLLDGAVTAGGNADNNIISGNAAANTLYGNEGNDLLYGRDGDDRLLGGDGDDHLSGGSGYNLLIGGTGNDVYYIDSEYDEISEAAGCGYDTVRTSLPSFFLAGHTEAVTYTGTGNFSGTGTDLDNLLAGGDGDDVLVGKGGHDLLKGNAGNDYLVGGAGDDQLAGKTGTNRLEGGLGDDVYFIDSAADTAVEAAGEGRDLVQTTLTSWTLGANFEELRYTGSGAFSGIGNDDDNALYGGQRDDILRGAGGADFLMGSGGNDRLIGGAGDDGLLGGAGADVFVFERGPRSNDTIFDFQSGTDKIDLSAFRIGADHVGITACDGYTVLSIDSNRNGSVDFTITLAGAGAPAASDFLF